MFNALLIMPNGTLAYPSRQCPCCGAELTPHAGPEDGPATSWSHPKCAAGQSCKWSGRDGITNRQLSAKAAALHRAGKTVYESRPQGLVHARIRRIAPKYRYLDAAGNERLWNGIGRMPVVMSEALKAGKTLEDFAIK